MLKIFVCCFTLAFYTSSHAVEVEIGGLLLDNTISRSGHEFAYRFSQLWHDIPNTQNINVQIIEHIVPHAGTRLTMKMNHKRIYVTYMGRRQSPITQRVEQAVLILIQAMTEYSDNENNPDMAGSGW